MRKADSAQPAPQGDPSYRRRDVLLPISTIIAVTGSGRPRARARGDYRTSARVHEPDRRGVVHHHEEKGHRDKASSCSRRRCLRSCTYASVACWPSSLRRGHYAYCDPSTHAHSQGRGAELATINSASCSFRGEDRRALNTPERRQAVQRASTLDSTNHEVSPSWRTCCSTRGLVPPSAVQTSS